MEETKTTNWDKPFQCDECGKYFETHRGVLRHKTWEHDPAARARMLAGIKKGVETKMNSDDSLTTRHFIEGVGWKCSQCDHKPYKSDSGLRYHLSAHHGEKLSQTGKGTEKCPECDYESSPNGVALHRRLAHGVEGKISQMRRERGLTPRKFGANKKKKKFECPYCNFTTNMKSGLTRHTRQQHPNATGLAEMRPTYEVFPLSDVPVAVENNVKPTPTHTLTDKIMQMVADKIAAEIMKGIK